MMILYSTLEKTNPKTGKKSGKLSKATPYLSEAVKRAYPDIVKEYVEAMTRIAIRFEKRHGVSRVYGRYK